MNKVILTVIAALFMLGSCMKPYSMEKCYSVHAHYPSDNNDSTVREFYTVGDSSGACNNDKIIKCHKLWIKTTDTTQSITYFTDSTTRFTTLRQWELLDYTLR